MNVHGFALLPPGEPAPDKLLPIWLYPMEHEYVYGFGWNPSTQGMLAALARLDLQGKTVLDVGTGTGILAIAAARLGARVGVEDTDPVCLKAAAQNAELNGVQFESVSNPDVVLANLGSGEWVEQHLPRLGQTLVATIPVAEQALVLAHAHGVIHVRTDIHGSGDQRFAVMVLEGR